MTIRNLSRRKLMQTSAAIAALGGLGACDQSTEAPVKTGEMVPASDVLPNIDISDLMDDVVDFLLTAYPESATSMGLDKGKRKGLKSKLTDRSQAGQDKIEGDVRTLLKRMQSIKAADLSSDDALTLDVVRTQFETAASGFDFPYGDIASLNLNWSYRNSPYAVAQNTGAFVEIPSFLDSSHSIETKDDADAYLMRLSAYAEQLDGETDRARAFGEQGVIIPDFLMKKTLGQLKGAMDRDAADWGLVSAFAAKTKDLGGTYGEEALALTREKILPAMERQIAVLEAQAPKSTSDAGLWAKPGGDAYYEWNIQASTTTTMTADEVHQMGIDELAELHGRMEPILQSIGYTKGTVGDRMTALADDPRYHFADGDEGREEIMTFIADTVADIRTRMPNAHEVMVLGFLEVTRINPEVEAGAPGAYGGAGTADGKKPGHFWINLRTPKLHNKFGLMDLTYHEAIPGHVWQGEYTFKLPQIRSMLAFNAYSEGWALYAQQLADELGVYDDFPVGRLGYLQSLAFRACRLVVDTGLHAKRWGREQAIDWFVKSNGSSYDEVQGEIDRYCAWPGQALGYKVGHTAINRLRAKAQDELGDKYNFKRFNDSIVLGGAVPMTVLGRVVDGYIERERG